MLTRDLLRVRRKPGTDAEAIEPQLLGPTPAITALAEGILGHWRSGIGKTLGELEDASGPVLHASRSLVVAKGLQKLVLDGCTFTEAVSAAELREKAFAASAVRLSRPAATAAAHQAQVAQDLELTPEALGDGLYADLPDRAVLTAAPDWTAPALIDRYNLALCQGLLLSARALTVRLVDGDTGRRRRLLTALRWHRLLAEVDSGSGSGGSLVLRISGPDAVLDQASRYGLNLALFLPALATCRGWEAEAEVRVGPERRWATLRLNDESGLRSHLPWNAFVPDEIRSLETQLKALPDVVLVEPPLIRVGGGGELVVPDLALVQSGRTVAVELFHRWHHHTLGRRLDQLPQIPDLILGIDRAVARRPDIAPRLETPAIAARIFSFTDLPTARMVLKAVGQGKILG